MIYVITPQLTFPGFQIRWYLVPPRTTTWAQDVGHLLVDHVSFLWLWRLMIWVTGSIVHLSPLDLLPFLILSSPFALAYPYSSSIPHPPISLSSSSYHYTQSIIHSTVVTPTTWRWCFFLHPRCYSFVITASLHRSAVAVHCCGVPVHPPASHWRHPHVHRGLSLWQCHRRPKTQRLRRHIHRAVRWVASWYFCIFDINCSLVVSIHYDEVISEY